MDKFQLAGMTHAYAAGDSWKRAESISAQFEIGFTYVHPDRDHEGRGKEQWDQLLANPAGITGRDLCACRVTNGGAHMLTMIDDVLIVIGELYEMPHLTLRGFEDVRAQENHVGLAAMIRNCALRIGHKTKYGKNLSWNNETSGQIFTTESARALKWKKDFLEDDNLSADEKAKKHQELREHCAIGDRYAIFIDELSANAPAYADQIAHQLDALVGDRHRRFVQVGGAGWEFYLVVTNELPFHAAIAAGTAERDDEHPALVPAYIPAKGDKWYLSGVWPTLKGLGAPILLGVREFVVTAAKAQIHESRANTYRIEVGCYAEAIAPHEESAPLRLTEMAPSANYWTFRADEIPEIIPEDGVVCRNHDGVRAFRDRGAAEKWTRHLLASWNEDVSKAA